MNSYLGIVPFALSIHSYYFLCPIAIYICRLDTFEFYTCCQYNRLKIIITKVWINQYRITA